MDFKQFYKTINFDIDNEIRTVFQATQGDTKSRGLLVDLIVGGVKTPVTTETIRFFALKPDGTKVVTQGVKDGTRFRIDFTNQTFAVSGVLLCTLVLSGTNGEKIADKKFKMNVDSTLEDGAIISEDERGILDRAFDLATDIVPRLEGLDVPLLENLEQRIDNIITTPVPTGEVIAQEIIDARQGALSVGANITDVKSQLAKTAQDKIAISKPKAIITIESDDALITDYTVLLPFLNARNVPATIAIPPGKLNGRMSWEQIHDLVDNYGWSVCSHTVNEVQLGTVTVDVVEQELKQSKEMIEAQGLKCDHLSYPNGSYNDEVMEIAKKYYKSSTTIMNGVNTAPMMSQKLFRASLYSRTLEQLKVEVDKAVASDGWFIIYTHGDDFANNPAFQDKLSDLIEYAQGKDVAFLNHDDAWDEMGNIIDLGVYGSETVKNNFVLSKRGDAVINGLRVEPNVIAYDASVNPFNINSVITDFELNKITYAQIDSSRSTGFPENKAGMLVTNRINQWNGYQFQEYHIILKNKVYRRVWSSSGWSVFQLVQADHIINKTTPNTYTFNSTITEFPLGKLTYTQITNVSGFPEGMAGLLETNYLVEHGGYPYQMYHIGGVNRQYKRFWTGSAWSEFRKIISSNTTEVSIDFGLVEAGQIVSKTTSIAGVANTDNLVCTPKFAINNNVVWASQISATNTIEIRIFNPTDASINVGTRTFKVNII